MEKDLEGLIDGEGVDRGRARTLKKNYKSQAPNLKQIPMTKNPNSKRYDLEERTLKFATRQNL